MSRSRRISLTVGVSRREKPGFLKKPGFCGARGAGMLLLLALCGRVVAEDRVTVQPSEVGSPIVVVGEIDEFNARRITIRVNSGVPLLSYPTDEVLNVSTHYGQQHLQGVSEFEAGHTGEARRLLEEALPREPRVWVQRELRAWLVRCALRDSDRRTAGIEFVEIVNSDAETRHWGVAPLVWAPESIGDSLREAAGNWLAARPDPVKLLGASILLLDPTFGEAARQELDRLTRSSNRYVVDLAKAQQWRLQLIHDELSTYQISSWNERIDRMPKPLRGGPCYLLGRAYAGRGDLEQAAASFLWVPLVYGDDPLLSARASLEAANALERLGRTAESAALYGELVERYAWSPCAAEARSRLESQATRAGTAKGG
jgi:tetratricopeptide (TPR) repeat protein